LRLLVFIRGNNRVKMEIGELEAKKVFHLDLK